MLVVDASAFTALVVGGSDAAWLAAQAEADAQWTAPEHFTVEVMSALRGAWLGGILDERTFPAAVQRLADAVVESWPVRPLLARLVELAPNASAYDAAYLALAEHLDAPLLTADARLARVPGIRCQILHPPSR